MNKIASVNRLFLITVLISIIGSFINGYISSYTDNYFILLLISQIMLVAPSLIYFIKDRINIANAIRVRPIHLSNVILVIIFAFLIQPLMNFINALSMIFVQNTTSEVMFGIVEKNGFWLSLFLIGFVPAILEETVYRGVFYNEYRKVNPWKGILLSAFLFGIIHGNLNQFSYAFAMGIVFALLIEATDSILSTMIVHFVINGTSVILLEIYPRLLKYLENVYGMEQYNAQDLMNQLQNSATLNFAYIVQTYGISALIFTPLAFIVFRAIAKNTGRWDFVKNIFHAKEAAERYQPMEDGMEYRHSADFNHYVITTSKKKSLFTTSLIAGIIICVIMLIINELFAVDNSIQPLEDGNTLIIFLRNVMNSLYISLT
ncbi:MAG: Abortive infection protein [Anaerocolumna sp.]|jgi:membrane protease YdiL (CAAX protease family)|nr:Abortive infection protein [Anaerocolumna sp.]